MTGVSADTPVRLVVDGGELAVGTTDVGALEDPVTFTVEREYYAPDFTRMRGDVEGTVFVIREVPKLACTLSEWQLAKVQYALPGTTLTSDASSEVLTSTPGRIAAASHGDVVFKTKKADAKEIEIHVDNAICRENLEVEFPDTETARYPVVFVGHYDPAAPTTAPWSIINKTA